MIKKLLKKCKKAFIDTAPKSMKSVYIVIGINVLVYILECILGDNVREALSVGPSTIIYKHQYWRLFTSMFAHAGLYHIYSNMMTLYVLSNILLRFTKEKWFWFFGLTGALIGNIASVLIYWKIGNITEEACGASGIVYALLAIFVDIIESQKIKGMPKWSGWGLVTADFCISIYSIMHGEPIDFPAHAYAFIGCYTLLIFIPHRKWCLTTSA